MATINYITLKFPQKLLSKYLEPIQKLQYFTVYRNKNEKGIIFRIPHGLKEDDVCHFFIEHEVNLSNTLKTGTFTMKVQVTIVPCHMGLFSGFKELKGHYKTSWHDEDDYESSEEYFIPDYDREDNVKKIVPLPINIKTNLYEYLEEILFSRVDDENLINKYVADLGCQKEKIKDKIVFIPVPENTGTSRNAKVSHAYTKAFFESLEEKQISLIPLKFDK
jgi:hypothetical protein